jgi:hypothetical protein
MEVEDGEDGALAGRGEGDADAPDAAPARPASASAITAIVLALGDAARAGQQRGDQALGGVPGGGSTDDAAGLSSEGQQDSGTHLAGQVAVARHHYTVDCDQEVDTYRTIAGHQFNEGKFDVKANILKWWKLHAVRFPYLSRLARRYLAMTATNDSVERLFSVAGQVVTAKRACLDPSTVTLLVFLHETIPGGIERESYEIIESALEIENDKYLDTGDQ